MLENPLPNDRARKAEKIIARPQNYKICEGCESIVSGHVSMCPNCCGYRFEVEAEAVVLQAKILAGREQTSVVAEDLL